MVGSIVGCRVVVVAVVVAIDQTYVAVAVAVGIVVHDANIVARVARVARVADNQVVVLCLTNAVMVLLNEVVVVVGTWMSTMK